VEAVETEAVNSNSNMTTTVILGLRGPHWLICLTVPCLDFQLDVDGN